MTTRPAIAAPDFAVIPGAQVQRALEGREPEVVELVENAYRLYCAGGSANPPSYFLKLPGRPSSRIIALPASLGGSHAVDGLKWISSFPANVAAGLPRASGVQILNDPDTGYPFACLEASVISATRTAAFAASAARRLSAGRPLLRRIGFVGSGLIARYIHGYLAATGWTFDQLGVYDVSAESAAGFRCCLEQSGAHGRVTVHQTAEQLVRYSDLVVFATVAAQPHVDDVSWFEHAPVVLHVSLRDLAPEILLASTNIVDDVEHCLRAETSAHLVEQRTGSRDFVAGTLADVMDGTVAVPTDRPIVFSPFGLGILDLAVGKYIYDQVAAAGELQVVDDFFHELRRHG